MFKPNAYTFFYEQKHLFETYGLGTFDDIPNINITKDMFLANIDKVGNIFSDKDWWLCAIIVKNHQKQKYG